MLLMLSQDFGFGPAAAVALIADALRTRRPALPLAFAGTPFSLQIQNRDTFDQVFTIGPSDSDRIKFLERIKGRVDSVFTVCDFKMAQRAAELGMKVILYDMLLWFWDWRDVSVPDGALYLVQRFYGTASRADELRRQGHHVLEVGPIVCDSPYSPGVSTSHAVVNINGFRNPFQDSQAVEYMARLADTIVTCVRKTGAFERIVACGDKDVIRATTACGPHHHTDCVTASPQVLSKTIARAKACFTTPGLGSIYQCLYSGVPTFFLPPTNSSQRRQMNAVRKALGWDYGLDWPDLLDVGAPRSFSGEQDEVDWITECLSMAHRANGHLEGELLKSFAAFVHDRRSNLDAHAARGRSLVAQMGGVGVKSCVDSILEYLGAGRAGMEAMER